MRTPAMDAKGSTSETNESHNNVFALNRIVAPAQNPDVSVSQDDNSPTAGRWTAEEHLKFIQGIGTSDIV